MTTNADNAKVELNVDGIKARVYPDAFDDLELLEDLVSIDKGDNSASLDALKRLFGDEYDSVKEELRDERGIVRTSRASALFFGVLKKLAKNS